MKSVSLRNRPVETTVPASIEEALATPWPVSSTTERWELLATLAAADLGIARAVEPHLDALGIFAEAGLDAPSGSWGVFAAEGSPEPLRLENGTLSGVKPWCSLASQLDHALVTAEGALYAVDLSHTGITVDDGAWMARGLSEIPSGPVRFDRVPATPVGAHGWYLSRPGFARGGVGVAACWFGGAVGIARTVFAAAVAQSNPFLLMHLGAIDEQLFAARLALADAAHVDVDRVDAARVRTTVAGACEAVIHRAGHALGPAPLALDAAHTKRVADLTLYVRQHHAEKDLASLGEKLAATGVAPW